MPATKLSSFSSHNIGDLRCLDDTVCRLLPTDGWTILECVKPGYNLKLGKRARVLLPGQMTFETAQVFTSVF